jgi:ligand-binding sensor domain-containing protein/AraC-like DNA-binding protein
MFVCAWVSAQAQDVHFYGPDQLSSTKGTTIVQDGHGFVWVGTEHGLNRFDGYSFAHYFQNQNDRHSLNSNTISRLFADGKGRLWIGTSKGLMRYDENADCFTDYPMKGKPRVTAIAQGPDGQLWVGTAGFGLFRLDARTGKMERLEGYSRPGDNMFSRFCWDAKGNFWKAANHGSVTCRESGSGLVVQYATNLGNIVKMVNWRQGVLMAFRRGLMYFDGERMHADYLQVHLNADISDMATDAGGSVYIATLGSGMYCIDEHNRLEEATTINNRMGTSSANIFTMAFDRDNTLWLGCQGRGLYVVSGRAPMFDVWSFARQNYKLGSSVSSACLGDGKVKVWATVENVGVFGFDSSGHVAAHPSSPKNPHSICRDEKGRIWLGNGEGLYAYDPDKGTSKLLAAVKSRFVNAIVCEGGAVYFSAYGEGLFRYDVATGTAVRLDRAAGKSGRLPIDWITAMMVDSRSRLWIATINGLYFMDTRTGSFSSPRWKGVKTAPVGYSLGERRNGDVLVGTDNGLYVYRLSDNEIEAFPASGALGNKVVEGLVVLGNGDFWCSTSEGIWQWSSASSSFIGYIRGDGLSASEYVGNVALKDVDGYVYFAIGDGITRFRPDRVARRSRRMGDVHLVAFLLGGIPVNSSTLSGGSAVFKGTVVDNGHFRVAYDDRDFTLVFSTLRYDETDNVSYSYRLNGRKWIAMNVGENRIPFNEMSPGRYRIEVRGYDHGAYSAIRTIVVDVASPWYASTTSIIVYLIVLVLITAFVIYFRKTRKHYQQEIDTLHTTIDEKDKTIGLAVMKGHVDDIEVKGNSSELMERITRVVNSHLCDNDFNVDMLAREVGISRTGMNTKMKEMTGTTAADFIRNLRLEQAAQLLKEGKLNVSQTCFQVGFNNVTHFSALFKKHFGVSPSEYEMQGKPKAP